MRIPKLAPFKQMADLKPMKVADLKPIDTGSVSKRQSLKEWHAAGGGVPVGYEGREHVWHKKVQRFAAGGAVAASIDGNEFVKAAQAAGLDTDTATLNKIVVRVNKGESLQAAARSVAQSHAAGGGVFNTVPDMADGGKVEKGGDVHMGAGGVMTGLIGAYNKADKAVDAAMAAKRALPAAERNANKANFLEPSAEKRRMYHGTKSDVQSFYPGRKGSFVSPDPEFASDFAESSATGRHGPNVMPVRVQVRNPFDYDNPAHMKAAREAAKKRFPGNKGVQYELDAIAGVDDTGGMHSNWSSVEHPDVQRLIKELGHDAYYSSEAGVKNLGIYDPKRIKSDIGNRGTYDINKADINEAHGGAVHMAKGGVMGVGINIAEAVAKASKKADKIIEAQQAPKGVEPIVVKDKPAKAAKPANYSPKVLESTAARFAERIATANPKMPAEEVSKKAMTQATKKLEWERTQKPELEKRYGDLVRSSYSDSNPMKQQNTPDVVRERMRKANEFLDQPTEPWTPPKPELQAFDRSSIKDALEGFPGVEQSKFPRDTPSRANIEHVEGLYTDPANRALIEKQILRGLPLGGETFYASLYPVKQAVLEAGMPAEKFDQWIHGLAPASARNSIMNEMASGQLLRSMNARGIPLTEENVAKEMALFQEKFGIGVPLMLVHREGVAKVLEGGQNLRDMSLANIPTNYKIPTYGSQKAGDFANSVVLDVHEARGQTQGSKFHPYFKEQGGFGNTEYNAGEQGMLGIAQDLGIPGGMAQAGRWFGGGELTGLRSPRGDALDLLEKQVAYTLQQKGVQPNPANVRAEVLRQIETGEGDLLPWYRKEGMPDVRQTGLQRAEGGEVHMADGGLIEAQHFDDGGIVSPEESLTPPPEGNRTKAGLMAELLAKMAREQGSKEVDSLSKPGALTDLLNRGVLANNPLSAVVDLVNMGLVPLDVLGSKLTGRDIKVSSDKPFLGSEYVKDLMNEYNVTSGEERPMMEAGLSFASPTGMIKGALKTAKLAKKAPETLSTVRGGLETMSANAQRPFRPATLTMEAVAPDLGQKGGDKFKDLVTNRMISGEGAPVSMERMGGRKTEQTMGQGLYENFAKKLETNPMVGVTIPRAGNLSTNKRLISDIGTAGRELGQEMVAAHKFTPLMFKNPKDATAMMIGGSEPLTKDQIRDIYGLLPGMIVTHSPKNNSMFVAPFEGDALDYKKAVQAANEILGKDAKVQFGKADSNKDIMYRGDYDKMEARPPSAESTEMRNRLKKAEERIVRGPSVSQPGRQSQPATPTNTVR